LLAAYPELAIALTIDGTVAGVASVTPMTIAERRWKATRLMTRTPLVVNIAAPEGYSPAVKAAR
jgi:hypothetical protein